jgi:cation diffusion facilitator CzcD-associated flavoprotein CzcO
VNSDQVGQETVVPEYDVLVIGAGFGGLRLLHELRGRGFSVRVLEAGGDVGGTWYWNRYPGARTDSEAWVYCYSFDQQLQQDWNWPARFPAQPDVHAYLRHVADRFDLRRDIELDARVVTAEYDEGSNRWNVATQQGRHLRCTFLVAATGNFSVPYEPAFPGIEHFAGEVHHSQRWPQEAVSFAGKRVGVVGTGATAVQIIPEVAHTAARLTVFQRTPTYVIPSRNHPLEDHQRAAIKAGYADIWKLCRRQVFAFPIERSGRRIDDVTPAEHQRILEAGWERGGFRFIFETLDDLTADPRSNAVAAEFVRNKIRTIVQDPETAERLCPKDHPIGAKRIPLGHHYYETYNRKNVELVSIRENPIEQITAHGMRLADGSEYHLDMLILALGFDAATGALSAMSIRGRDGRRLGQEWSSGARTYLGLGVEGYPNLFILAGPHSPILNFPVLIEHKATWIGRLLEHMRATGKNRIEPSAGATERWSRRLKELFDATLLPGAEAVGSYYVGANIPGKATGPLFYFGGAPKYFREIDAVADAGYEGYSIDAHAAARGPGPVQASAKPL